MPSRWGRLLGSLALILALFGSMPVSGTAGAPPVQASAPINHVVVIYMENHSFDNYFGLFPGADNLANAGAAAIQMDKQGNPYATLPPPLADPPSGPRTPDPRFPPNMPNGPFLFNQYVQPTDHTGAIIHAFYRQQYQINGGQMNKFATWSDGAGMVMGYWDMRGMPLWQLAEEYTLADRFFHAAFGGSFLNHQWLICACTPVYPNAPDSMVSKPFPDDPDHMQDLNLTPDGYVVNTSYSVNAPHPADAKPETLIPNQTLPTIGDRLTAAGVSWAWYSGGWNDALAGRPMDRFQFHHQPFVFYANYADGTAAKAQHLRDETEFYAALQNGSLPAVSFVKPVGLDNEHPSYATVQQGEAHLGETVRAIQASPYWPQTAIIITYDENGGAWDHVAPPVIDRWGPGARVPAVIVSPWAKRGFIDHTTYDTTSILKLIEWRWGLAPLGTRDAAANNLLNAFDFSAAQPAPVRQLPRPAAPSPAPAALPRTGEFDPMLLSALLGVIGLAMIGVGLRRRR